MNVLFNLPSIPLYPDRFEMLKCLSSKLDTLTVVTNELDDHYKATLPGNMSVLKLSNSKPRFLEGLLSKTSYRSVDIIHDTFGYFLPLGPLAKMSRSKRYVTSVYGSSAGWYRKAKELGVKDELELNLHKNLMRREKINSTFCDAIIVNSQTFTRDFVELFGYPESKIHEVPNCITVDDSVQYSKPEGPFNVLYVGQISRMKGIHVLLKAFQGLEEQDARLTVIGKHTPHDRRLLSNKWSNVEFLEPMPHTELAAHYRAASLFCHPSYQEGMPRVVMEALSFGVPVVAAALPGIKTLDETGQLIRFMENHDAGALKNILASEISSPRKTAAFFQTSRARMNQFSPEKTASKILEVYEKL
ncbi:MAG: glycosyltransferase family 4 protein [Deltaproteobacteria bacterium]|nr:glycosyltransferase family 4 protein [Deltaproteobacteria bacterium]